MSLKSLFSLCNVTQLLNALSTPEGRESDLYVSFFARNGKRRKRTKRNSVTEKGT